MPQVVEHHDHPMGEEVASSAPHASCCLPPRVVARIALQRATEQASLAPMQPAPNGPLVAARELLRNPPDPVASPDVLRQWCDNLDRLLNLAQVTPGSAGGSASRQRCRQGGASGSVQSPASPRYVEPFYVFPMHLLSRLPDRGSVTRRCWRSWQPIGWKPSPTYLPWRTSAPGLLRAVHGSQPLKEGPPRRGAPLSLPLAAARRRTRRIAAQTSYRPELRSLQRQRPGARTRVANLRASSVATLGRALFILEPNTAPPNAMRS
jgi:hypothetical protein